MSARVGYTYTDYVKTNRSGLRTSNSGMLNATCVTCQRKAYNGHRAACSITEMIQQGSCGNTTYIVYMPRAHPWETSPIEEKKEMGHLQLV